MNRKHLIHVFLGLTVLTLYFNSSFAKSQNGPQIRSSLDRIYTSGVINPGKSVTDTLQVYGGPGTNEGTFQSAGDPNVPDWQGWTSVDETEPTNLYWHIDDFYCASLDPGTPDNKAWWCGEVFPSCNLEDLPGGYGNGYTQYLDWHHAPPVITEDVTVRVQAVLNYDVEPGYDYLNLEYVKDYDTSVVLTFNDQGTDVFVDESQFQDCGSC